MECGRRRHTNHSNFYTLPIIHYAGDMAPTELERSERLQFGQFLAKAVTVGTRSGYEGDWKEWVEFVGKRQGLPGSGMFTWIELIATQREQLYSCSSRRGILSKGYGEELPSR